jgi:hypothetical protein
MGFTPSEFCSLQRAVPLSRSFALLPLNCRAFGQKPYDSLDFRALLPLKSRTRDSAFYTKLGAVTLLGFAIFGVLLSSDPADSREWAPLLCFSPILEKNRCGTPESFCQKLSLTVKVCLPL